MPRLFRPTLLGSLILIAIPALGLAAEEPPALKALLDNTERNTGVRPTYSDIIVDADGTVRIKNLGMVIKAGPTEAQMGMTEALKYEIEQLEFSGTRERAPGKFEIAKAKWTGMTMTISSVFAVAMPVIEGSTIYINKLPDQPTDLDKLLSANMWGKEFTVPEGLILVGGKSIPMGRVRSTWDGNPDTGAGITHIEISPIRIPGEVFAAADGSNMLSEVGYQSLEVGMVAQGLTTQDGTKTGFDFQIKLSGKDMGELIIDMAADGLPASLLTAASSPDPKLETLVKDAEGISFRRVKIRFEDASVTTRLLAMGAKMQGKDVDSLINDMTAAAQVSLAQLGSPGIANESLAALGVFLKNPRSITLMLAPPEPVQGAQIMQAMQDPAALIRLLALKVTAND